jgi:hypothetical protein
MMVFVESQAITAIYRTAPSAVGEIGLSVHWPPVHAQSAKGVTAVAAVL